MSFARLSSLAVSIVVISLLFLSPATSQASEPNSSDLNSAPAWGVQDQKGALNRVGPQQVVDVVKLVTEGKVYDLGRIYEPGMPLFGTRHFKLTIPGSPTGGPMGDNRLVYHDEMFSGEIGQIGTQLDGLAHIAIRDESGEDIFYNGHRGSEIRTPYGFSRLGIENFRHLVARGILIDIPKFKGVKMLASDYIITVEDLEGALGAQKIEVQEADVVLIRTGHGLLWMVDNEAYNNSEPGPGISAIRWLIEQKIVLLGADNWGVEAVPGENPERPFEGHEWLLQQNGIYTLENLDLETLASDQIYEFAFVFLPVPIRGATGSPGNPIAIR